MSAIHDAYELYRAGLEDLALAFECNEKDCGAIGGVMHVLQCGHSFCVKCLPIIRRESEFLCPTCLSLSPTAVVNRKLNYVFEATHPELKLMQDENVAQTMGLKSYLYFLAENVQEDDPGWMDMLQRQWRKHMLPEELRPTSKRRRHNPPESL